MKEIVLDKKTIKELRNKKNVIGWSMTSKLKESDGKTEPIHCLRVYVAKKEPLECLSKKDVIPSVIKIQNSEICTDVVEIGEIKALSGSCIKGLADKLKKKSDEWVCQPGCSSAHIECTACTTNMLFNDNDDNGVVIASNNHCYALENKAKKGDIILSPSPYDNGKYPDDVVGYLKKFVEIKFNGFTCPYRNALHKLYRFITRAEQPVNKVDIGFRTHLGEKKWDNNVIQIGACNGKTLAKINDLAFKYGRTTNYTEGGKVIDLDWVGTIGYGRGQTMFVDCILIEKTGFSAGGDSGSPVFVDNNLYIGALFAGSDTHTIICKIANIETEGNVTLPVEWVTRE